jgi:DNA-binding IclR family transcriptional regulator
MARALHVNRSTALRLLGELERSGYVARNPATKEYASVPDRLLRLSGRRDVHREWLEIVHPVLSGLRDRHGEAVIQAVPADVSMVYVAFFPSRHPIAVQEGLGTVRPMHSSALGRAYLSAFGASPLDRELGKVVYDGGTARAPQGPLELRRRVEETRERGFAVDLEETFDGVSCVAAPTYVGGVLFGAAGVSGPSSRLAREQLEEIGRDLLTRLARIAAA